MSDSDYDHLSHSDLIHPSPNVSQSISPTGSTATLSPNSLPSDLSESDLDFASGDPLKQAIRTASGLETEYQEAKLLREDGTARAQGDKATSAQQEDEREPIQIPVDLLVNLLVEIPRDGKGKPSCKVNMGVKSGEAPHEGRQRDEDDREQEPMKTRHRNEAERRKKPSVKRNGAGVKAALPVMALSFFVGVAATSLFHQCGGSTGLRNLLMRPWSKVIR